MFEAVFFRTNKVMHTYIERMGKRKMGVCKNKSRKCFSRGNTAFPHKLRMVWEPKAPLVTLYLASVSLGYLHILDDSKNASGTSRTYRLEPVLFCHRIFV